MPAVTLTAEAWAQIRAARKTPEVRIRAMTAAEVAARADQARFLSDADRYRYAVPTVSPSRTGF